jgi:DNA-binding response OmpR family regulator
MVVLSLENAMEQKRRILIIDDSKEIVAGLKAFLEKQYEVITAYDGFDGLQAFENNENSIDLVITDLMMPELSGVGVISILKKKYPGVPVIAITGWRGDFEATGTKIDADQVLEKPFDVIDLEKSVSMLLKDLSSCPSQPEC